MFEKPELKYSLSEITKMQIEFAHLTLNIDTLKKLKYKNKIENPILILPGFLTNGQFHFQLKNILSTYCDNVYYWDQGFNFGFNEKTFKHTVEYILSLYKKHKKEIILLGHSLGGVYAKEIAKFSPEIIHSIYTFGSPLFDMKGEHSPLKLIYYTFNPKHRNDNHTKFEKNIIDNYLKIPDVNLTSFYSKKDGVVHWTTSVLPEMKHLKNIEVDSSHCGMLFNYDVINAFLQELFEIYE